MGKLIYGVGKFDGNHVVTKSEKIDGKFKTVWSCNYYTLWRNMLKRCYDKTYPEVAYKSCTVHASWFSFSNFYSWAKERYKDGLYLDKDVLIQGNLEYHPDRCVFVSRQVNNFLTDRKNHRGMYPLGVHRKNKCGRYVAQCANPFGTTPSERRGHIGHYDTPEEAHKAWQTKKHEYACKLADLQDDLRVADALRQRYAPDKYWTNKGEVA